MPEPFSFLDTQPMYQGQVIVSGKRFFFHDNFGTFICPVNDRIVYLFGRLGRATLNRAFFSFSGFRRRFASAHSTWKGNTPA